MPTSNAPTLAAALSALPPSGRALFERALALDEALPADASPDDKTSAERAFHEAMTALGLPPFAPFTRPDGVMIGSTDRPVLTVAELSEPQRLMLGALVDRSDLFTSEFCIPGTAWSRRQWLELAPPGPLWSPLPNGEPLYFELRRRLLIDDEALDAYLSGLPNEERAPLLFELDLAMGDLWGEQRNQFQAIISELGSDLGAWAVTAAERVLAGVPRAERTNQDHTRSQLVFAALVKAGIPIEPRFDALLRLHQPKPVTLLDDWIAAIPEPRREAAVMAALEKLHFVNESVALAARLLPRWPFVELALYAEKNLKDSRKPKEVKQVLKDVSAAHAPIKKAIAAWRKSRPKPLKLKVTSAVSLDTLLPLDDVQAKQLEAAAREYNGIVCSISTLLAGECGGDEPIIPDSIEYRRLEGPRGQPAFDLWGMMTDSGTFFRAGTTDIVARISQFDVDCDEPVLGSALQLALRGAT